MSIHSVGNIINDITMMSCLDQPCSASRGEGAAESTPLEPSERSVESPAN